MSTTFRSRSNKRKSRRVRTTKAYVFVHTYLADCKTIHKIESKKDLAKLIREGKIKPLRTLIGRVELRHKVPEGMLEESYQYIMFMNPPMKIINHDDIDKYVEQGIMSYGETVCTDDDEKKLLHVFTIVVPGKKVVSGIYEPLGWKILREN